MTRWCLLPDTIANRFAITITAAIAVAVALTVTATEFGGSLARPAVQDAGLLERVDDITRLIEALPGPARAQLAQAASNPSYTVTWYGQAGTVGQMLDGVSKPEPVAELLGFHFLGGPRRIAYLRAGDANPAFGLLPYDQLHSPRTRFFGVRLRDQSWIVFTIPERLWGLPRPMRLAIGIAIMTLSIALVSRIACNHLARPIRVFTAAVTRFGVDPKSTPVPENGPRELRRAIVAFNAMQAQIQRFVDDRTAMLAAISHDLRTPLTRMRLRAELMGDDLFRERQTRDVDAMQAMIDSALSFFRDATVDEESTVFDLPELLRTIADDYYDQGIEVPYTGPDRAGYRGRPFAIKRAITNLVDNAVKYGERARIGLHLGTGSLCVTVQDEGPGIPAEAAEQVFAPFFRLEGSRNRGTGGVGLGLASARAVVRSHGGDIVLHNRAAGGLDVQVSLPA